MPKLHFQAHRLSSHIFSECPLAALKRLL